MLCPCHFLGGHPCPLQRLAADTTLLGTPYLKPITCPQCISRLCLTAHVLITHTHSFFSPFWPRVGNTTPSQTSITPWPLLLTDPGMSATFNACYASKQQLAVLWFVGEQAGLPAQCQFVLPRAPYSQQETHWSLAGYKPAHTLTCDKKLIPISCVSTLQDWDLWRVLVSILQKNQG